MKTIYTVYYDEDTDPTNPGYVGRKTIIDDYGQIDHQETIALDEMSSSEAIREAAQIWGIEDTRCITDITID